MSGENDLLTINDIAALTGKDPDAIRKAIKRKQLKGRKFGPIWVATRKDFEAWNSNPDSHRRGPKRKN